MEIERNWCLLRREACFAGRALRGGGAMKGGAAKSLGENEERNRLPWQGEAVPCVRRASEAVVEKAVEIVE